MIVHRLTKIVATLGPACSSDDRIDELIAAGTDVFRLNFSHGSHDEHAAAVQRIRGAAQRAGRHVAILQDLSGPKIRTGRLKDKQPIPLRPGDVLEIATGDFEGGPGRVSTTYAELARSVRPGDRLLLDDGRIELRVESTDGTIVHTIVIAGGPLGEHKGINAPGVALPTSALTAKDIDDLRFGLTQGIDLVAISFVQTAADVERARDVIATHAAQGDAKVPIIAKIERPMAVQNIDEILDVCNGVMVARGDLGLEMPFERVPRVQKEITRRARVRGLPVIVATQVFDSMRTEARPTRAEVSDAANAVDDAVDAIMLTGETATGVNPTRTVQTLDAVIRDAESIEPSLVIVPGPNVIDVEHNRALCEAAVTLAKAGEAAAIVALTRAGKTARVLSAFRPSVPVFAVCPAEVVARRLTIYRGVTPLTIELGTNIAETEAVVEQHLVSRGILAPGCVIVFVSVNADLTKPDANFLRIRRLGGD
jgi:pyruvate kinase